MSPVLLPILQVEETEAREAAWCARSGAVESEGTQHGLGMPCRACDLGTSAPSPVQWKQPLHLVGLWVPLQRLDPLSAWAGEHMASHSPWKGLCCSVLSARDERIWMVLSVPRDARSAHLTGCCRDSREF